MHRKIEQTVATAQNLTYPRFQFIIIRFWIDEFITRSLHCGKHRIWRLIHSSMEGTWNRASWKEELRYQDKHSRQFSDSTVIYWFCRQGGVWPVLCCQVQNSNDFNCFPMWGGSPPSSLFLKVVSYTHVPGNAARNRTVSEVFGIFQRDLDCGKHVCVLESATMLDKLPVDMQRDLLYITL